MRNKSRLLASVLLVALPTGCATTAPGRLHRLERQPARAHVTAAAFTPTPTDRWFDADNHPVQESVPQVKAGDLVRLRSRSLGKIQGVVQRFDDETIVILAAGAAEPTPVPLGTVTELELQVGRAPSRQRALLTGGLIGAAVGLVAGLLAFGGGKNDTPSTVVSGGAAAGGLIGLGFGAVLRAPVLDQWIEIEPRTLGE